MKAGSALIFLASSYHGGGHNSQPNSRRVVHGLFFCRGNLRQEENQFLSVPFNKVKDMSSKILELLGYKKPSSALGIVDNKCPTSDLEATFRNVMA
jgi:ectoine hydroxylase-related dioxygenase (phytanoyl-CoA dioxygenase family)